MIFFRVDEILSVLNPEKKHVLLEKFNEVDITVSIS